MSNYGHIKAVLQELSPMEVQEMCGLDEDTSVFVEALEDYIEDNLEDIEQNLIASSLISEGSE